MLPQNLQDQAEAIRVRLRKATDAARNDRSLSTAGKNQRIASAYKQATADMQQLADSFELNNRLSVSQLSRELFGSGSTASGADAISLRDASDRAAAVSGPDEALGLISRADRNGDRQLVRAVASHAADRAVSDPIVGPSWLPVLDRFVAAQGSAAGLTSGKINQLLNLRTSGDARYDLSNGLVFALPKPAEVQKMTQGELDAAGSGEPPPAQPVPVFYQIPGA